MGCLYLVIVLPGGQVSIWRDIFVSSTKPLFFVDGYGITTTYTGDWAATLVCVPIFLGLGSLWTYQTIGILKSPRAIETGRSFFENDDSHRDHAQAPKASGPLDTQESHYLEV